MKKLMIALTLALAGVAFAEEAAAPAADAKPAAKAQRARRAAPQKRVRALPTMTMITEKTTAEEIARFKAEIDQKIDARFAEFTAGTNKAPVRMMFMVSEQRPLPAKRMPRRPVKAAETPAESK